MKDLLQQADRIPVTLLVVIAYVTLFVLTNMPGPDQSVSEMLYAYGWLRPVDVVLGEPWRLITAAFLHGGIVHIGFNTLMLIAVGPALEMSLGSLRFLLLYLVSALGGHIAVCLFYPIQAPVVGGSGALFGMLGCLLALNMRSGRHLFSFLDFEGPRRLVGLVVANLLIGWFVPFISNTAHVGGLLAGFLLAFLWLEPGRAPTAALRRWRVAVTALFASLLFWSLQPATRYDWLWLRSDAVPAAEADALRRAAAMSFYDLPAATDADAARLPADIAKGPK